MSARRGFTLIELLIGLSLSLLVILAVYAGIRTAVRSITAVERVALENKILGIAMLEAVERADGWIDLDDPNDPTAQRLRTVPSKPYTVPEDTNHVGGLIDEGFLPYDVTGADWRRLPQPFTAFSASWNSSNPEAGYDPEPYDPDAWLPHRPRAWYRGDHAWYGEADYVDQSQYGNYGIAQAAAPRIQVIDGDPAAVSLAPWRRWLPDQQLALAYALGWYGWFDYLPANAMIDAYTAAANGRSFKPGEIRRPRIHEVDIDADLLPGSAPDGDPDTPVTWLVNARGRGFVGAFSKQISSKRLHGSDRRKDSLFRTGAGQAVTKGWQTWTLGVGISAQEPILNRGMAGLYNGADVYSSTGGNEALYAGPLLLASLADGRTLIDGAPDDWPILDVDVRRFVDWGSPRTHCYIRYTDPISGESRELFFPLTATTLRGARLGRGLDGP